MPNRCYRDHPAIVIDRVQHPLVANSDSVQTAPAELLASLRPGVLGEPCYPSRDPLTKIRGQVDQLLRGPRQKLEPVWHLIATLAKLRLKLFPGNTLAARFLESLFRLNGVEEVFQ
jgi:hypothetical protein